MITIEITEFIRPHGHKEQISGELPDSCAEGYKQIQEHRLRLTAEVIFGRVNFCIEDQDRGDYDAILVSNDAAGLRGLAAMIERFNSTNYLKWKEEFDKQLSEA